MSLAAPSHLAAVSAMPRFPTDALKAVGRGRLARPCFAPVSCGSLLLFTLLAAGCGGGGEPDSATAVPTGDPPFTPLAASWVIDNAGVLGKTAVGEASAVCRRLQDDGVAEVVVLVQPGVKHPADYATHYGRWLKLGRKGLSTEGGNNGVVWLIRPEAQEKMTYSVGEGLPRLTSGHLVDIMNRANEYFNFANYDEGVRVLVRETDRTLRDLYGSKGGKP
jgi:hypothetical protein